MSGKKVNHKSNNRGRKKNWSSKAKTMDQTDSMSKPSNDMEFYNKYPELLAAASRIPFPYVPGAKLEPGDLRYFVNGQERVSDTSFYYPGIMSLRYAPSIGFSETSSSPASYVAREMYAKIRSKFSGALEVDGPDLFMYCMALQQVHAYIACLKRIYVTIDYRTGSNRLVPLDLLRAYGLTDNEITDVISHKDKLWGNINTLIHSAAAFAVPDDMPIFQRMARLNRNVYRDTASDRSQLYAFVPHFFYKFSTEGTSGTNLVPQSWDTVNKSTQGLFEFGLSLIQALNGSDDALTIDGYIRRAYEGSKFVVSELAGKDDILEPVFDPVILSQIENFTGLGSVHDFEITQDPSTNAIIHKPNVTREFFSPLMLNIHSDSIPDAVDVIEATRFKAYVNENGYVFGSDVLPLYATMFIKFPNGTIQEFNYDYVVAYNVSDSNTVTSFGNTFDALLRRASFNGAPAVWLVAHNNESASANWFICDCAQTTVITQHDLNEITRVCLYSEFNAFTRV